MVETRGGPGGPMRQSAAQQPRHLLEPADPLAPTSESVDTLVTTTTTGSQYQEVVEVEEHERGSEAGEPLAEAETLKLTARRRFQHAATATSPIPPAPASDETKKEIQEDDEATLRELLVRWMSSSRMPASSSRGRPVPA